MTAKETMTPRERVQMALAHQQPDRVPFDLGGFQTGIHQKAYAQLIRHLGFDEAPVMLDPVQQLVVPSEQVLERLHVDIRYVTAHGPDSFSAEIRQVERGGSVWHDLTDEFGVIWSMPDEQQLYMDISHNPLAHAGVDDLDAYPFPDGGDPSRFTGVRERALHLRQNTPFALSSGICGVTYEICWYMRGLEQWFIDMKENPEFCEALLEKTSRFWVDWMHGFLDHVGDLLDVIMIGDDLSGQDGPLFSPAFYRSIVRPRQQRVIETVKNLTRAKVWYHTCGGCTEYIEDLINMGVDALNPVQISARSMVPEFLKARYGKRIVFWGGGIDAQHILPFEPPERVRAEVRKNMAAFKPGGGYVFCNCHNIQAGVPPENVMALYDAAYDSAFY